MAHALLTGSGPWVVPTRWDDPSYQTGHGLRAVTGDIGRAVGEHPMGALLALLVRLPPPASAPAMIRIAGAADIAPAVEALYGARLDELIDLVFDPISPEVGALHADLEEAADRARGVSSAAARERTARAAREEALRLSAEAEAERRRLDALVGASADVRREHARLTNLRGDIAREEARIESMRAELAGVDVAALAATHEDRMAERRELYARIAEAARLVYWAGRAMPDLREIERLEAEAARIRAVFGADRLREETYLQRAAAQLETARADLAAIRGEYDAWAADAPKRSEDLEQILRAADRDEDEIARLRGLMGARP